MVYSEARRRLEAALEGVRLARIGAMSTHSPLTPPPPGVLERLQADLDLLTQLVEALADLALEHDR